MKTPLNISVNKAIQLLLLFMFSLNVADSLFTPLFAIYIDSFIVGGTLATVGFATAIAAISKSIVQVPLARRLDAQKGERDDFYAMIIGALSGVVYPVLLIFAYRVWHLYLLQVFIGIGVASLMAAYYAIFSHHVDKDRQGFEWSLYSVGGLTMSVAIGSAFGGIIADSFGFRSLLLLSALLNAAGSLVLIWLYPYMDTIRKKVEPPQR